MSLPRRVSAETLDNLAENDPRAIRSRRDLQRVNRVMATRYIMLKALHHIPKPKRIVELGAGDGTLMLGMAKELCAEWPAIHLTLFDRQSLVSTQTMRAFHELGWQVELLNADIMDWTTRTVDEIWDLALCNLFMHHFDNAQLPKVLDAIARRSSVFFACEPRRAWLPLIGSHLIGLIGANDVTREDAVLSVHAGFQNAELSAVWPKGDWGLREYSAGLFSHCFVAIRQGEWK